MVKLIEFAWLYYINDSPNRNIGVQWNTNDSLVLQLQHFPKIQKILGPSFCLYRFDFLIWFDLMILQKYFFLMLELIHHLFKFIISFECVFKCLNRKFICLFSYHCGEIISFSFVILFRCICLNRLSFCFTSKSTITSFSVVADKRLWSPLMHWFFNPALSFSPILKSWAFAVAATKSTILPIV